MAKKILGYIKLQLPAGKATPQPPVGPALGQYGVAIPVFTKAFNEQTKNDIRSYHPRSSSPCTPTVPSRSLTKTPPAAVLIKKCRDRVRLRRAQQDQGRHHQQGRCAQDR